MLTVPVAAKISPTAVNYIGNTRLDLLVGAVESEQDITCHQHQFERDKKVEQITSKKCLRNSGSQYEIHRVIDG
jgi:hypothetical protein